MSGETDLSKLLRTLRPALDSEEYAFATMPPGKELPDGVAPLCAFGEAEGTSIIAHSADFTNTDIVHTPGWAKITLEVHSSLSAVGLTAAISQALAEAGISANVVAAYHHDHVFVPWHKRDEAMSILTKLSQTG